MRSAALSRATRPLTPDPDLHPECCQRYIDGMPATAPKVETPEYAKMVARMMRAHGRRVAEHGDAPDLADLIQLRAVLDETIQAAVTGMRESGASWATIAEGAGTSRQAAQQRWGA